MNASHYPPVPAPVRVAAVSLFMCAFVQKTYSALTHAQKSDLEKYNNKKGNLTL